MSSNGGLKMKVVTKLLLGVLVFCMPTLGIMGMDNQDSENDNDHYDLIDEEQSQLIEASEEDILSAKPPVEIDLPESKFDDEIIISFDPNAPNPGKGARVIFVNPPEPTKTPNPPEPDSSDRSNKNNRATPKRKGAQVIFMDIPESGTTKTDPLPSSSKKAPIKNPSASSLLF